jgi:hypothetical protein
MENPDDKPELYSPALAEEARLFREEMAKLFEPLINFVAAITAWFERYRPK